MKRLNKIILLFLIALLSFNLSYSQDNKRSKKYSNESYLSLRDNIYSYVNNLVQDYGGSFSAEHGIGQIKKNSLLKFKSNNEIRLMKNLKKAFDPKNILNPGKIFDI